MKRSLLSGAVLFLVVATVLVAGKAEAQEPQPPASCDVADALREAGRYEEARAKYAELLKANPQLGCVPQGLQLLLREQATHLYKLGQVYEANDQLSQARSMYVEALEVDPTLEEPWDALKKLEPLQTEDQEAEGDENWLDLVRNSVDKLDYEEATRGLRDAIGKNPDLEVPDDVGFLLELAKAKALVDQGFDEKATEALRGAIEKNPDLEVPDDLAYLVAGKNSLWRKLKQFVLRPGRLPWIEGLAALIIAVLVGLRNGPMFVSWLYSLFGRPRLDIENFDGSAAGGIGPGVAARVQEELWQLTTQGEFQQRVHVVEGSGGAFEIPAEIKTAAPSSLRIVFELIERLVPQNVVSLSGCLQKSDDRGAGLTLVLMKKPGQIIANETIWQRAYDPAPATPGGKDADAYYLLTQLAASWTLFQLAKWYDIPTHPLGTKEWRSYAYLQAGIHWRLEDEKVKARRMLMAASVEDSHNRGALFNLGALNTELGRYKEAREQLETVRQQLEKTAKQKDKGHLQDRMWYQVMYYLASTHAYQRNQRDAANLARTLASGTQTKLNELGEQPRKPEHKRLKKYLEWFEPLAVTLHLGIRVGKGEITGKVEDALQRESQTIQDIKEAKLHYRVHYNLACCYSVLGERDAKQRTHAYDKSLEHLKYALGRGGGIVRWAQNDPSLKGVRVEEKLGSEKTKKTFAKMFEELVEEYAGPGTPKPTDASLPLAGLAAIGNVYAGKLEEKGVVSVNDLIVNTSTHQGQQKLANDLGTDVILVQSWGRLADLMHIVGSVQYVNLLEAAGVYSRERLRGFNPLRLQELLYQVNQARSLVDQAPQPKVVWQWVNDASEEPKVW